MNKNVVEKTLQSIDNIDRLTDLAAISIYNTSYEALDKYDIMQEHATPEYVNEEFIQESVLAGVLIGAGIIGVAVSAFFIIKKIIDSGAKGDKSKKDSSPVAGVDLTKPEEAKKFLTAKVEEIKKWTEGSKVTIKHTYNKAAATEIANRIKAFSEAMVAVIDANGAEDIKKATDTLNGLDPTLPALLEEKEQPIDKTTNLFDLVDIECFTILAEAYKELEKRVADVEKQMKNKTKKEGAAEETEAVDAELQKTVKEKCNQFTNNVAKVIKDERGWMEELQTVVHNVQQVPAPAKEEPAAAETGTPAAENKDAEAKQAEAKNNGNPAPTPAPTNNGSGLPSHIQAHDTRNLQGQMNKSMEKTLNNPNADINFTPPTTGLDAKELNDNMQMPGISSTAVRDKEQLKLSPEEETKLDEAINSIEPYLRVNMRASDDDIKEFLMKQGYTPTVAIRAVDEYRTRQNLVDRDAEAKAKSMPSLNSDGTSSDDGDEASAANKIAQYINHAPMRNNLQKHLGQSGYSVDSNQLNNYLNGMASGDVKQLFTNYISNGAPANEIKIAYQIFNAIATQIGLTPGERAAIGLNFSVDEFLNSNSDLDQFKFDSIDKVVKANEGAKSEAEIKAILAQQGYTDEDIKKYYDQIKAGGPSPVDTDADEDLFKGIKYTPLDQTDKDEAAEDIKKEPEDLFESDDLYESIYDSFRIALEDAKDLGENIDQAVEKEIAFWKSEYTKDSLMKLAAKVKKDLGIVSNSDNSAEPEPTPTDKPTPLGFDHDYSTDNPAPTATHSVPKEIIDTHPSADIDAVNKNYDAIMNAIDKLNDPKYDPKFDPNPDPEGLMQRINAVPSYSADTKAAIFDAIKQTHPEINVPTVQASPTPAPTPSSEPTMEPITPPTSEPTPGPSPSPTPTMEPISTPTDQNDNIKDLAAAMEIPKDTSNPMDDAMTTYLNTKIAQDPKRGFTGADLDKAVNAVIERAKEMQANNIDPSKSSHIKNLLHGIYNRAAGSTFGVVGKHLIPGAERKKALQAAKDYAKYKMYSNQVGKYWSEMAEIHAEYRHLIMECNTDIIREEKLRLIQEQNVPK